MGCKTIKLSYFLSVKKNFKTENFVFNNGNEKQTYK